MHCRNLVTVLCLLAAMASPAATQEPPKPAVGVIKVTPQQLVETTEVNGRIEATDKVDLVTRVSAFLEERVFKEGAEVNAGELLFRLERPPFESDLEAKRASLDQANAVLENADIALDRNRKLQESGTGTQRALDDAEAAYRTARAQVTAAQAAARVSEINLGYTEIKAPISGRIGISAVTTGNVVTPSSGTLATIVSQDPMYVTFLLSTRQVIGLREKYKENGSVVDALKIRIRLPDGRFYAEEGKLDFFDTSISQDTDSLRLRSAIANPVGKDGLRELFNDEFVRVVLESVDPVTSIAVPRAAILTDQQGDYVYVVDDKSVVDARRVKLGQSTATVAAVVAGLSEGDVVVVDGVQRIRPGVVVEAQPASRPQSATQ